MREIELTEIERIEYKRQHKICKDKKQADRIKAILLLDKNFTLKQVSDILLIDENTIINWKDRFFEKRDNNDWLKDNYSGYDGRLNKEELNKVEDFTENNPISNAKQVQEYILNEFHKKYTVNGTTNILKKLGFVYKYTRHLPGKIDAEKQKQFKEFYENLESELPEDEVILFADSVHPQHNTEPTKIWIKKGNERFVKSNTGRARINLSGLYNPKNQDFIYNETKTVDTKAITNLLDKAKEQYPLVKTIHVIIDNARYNKSDDMKKYLEDSNINMIYLPTYSPNLNLIERLWKFLRKKVIKLNYYDRFSDFRKAVFGFLDNIKDYKDELKQFIGSKLHLLEPVFT